MGKEIKIRVEENSDYRKVEELVRRNFLNVYRPGCLEHYVLNQFRANPDFVKELDFVMELDGKIIGQNIFVKACIDSNEKSIPILTMGPICIEKEYRKMGYGKMLLEYSLSKAKELGYGAVCIEGNIDFYSKCGFKYAREYGLKYFGLDDGTDDSFFLCKELIIGYLNGVSGQYKTPDGYFVCDTKYDEFIEYDKTFTIDKK